MKNILRIFVLLLKAKYIFKKPKKQKIIIYDIPIIKNFNKHLGIKNFEILYVRKEKLNIFVIFKNFLTLKLTFREYIQTYIKLVKPKIVISFIDNSIFFYTLKNMFPDTMFIAIQNGYRTRREDFPREETFNLLKKFNQNLQVDYFFSFGKSIAKEYSKFIKFKNKTIGSFRNNIVPVSQINKKKNNLLYISQYREENKNLPEYFNIEIKLLPLILKYCDKFNLKLNILGCEKVFFDSEYQFYKKIIGLKKNNFIKKMFFPKNYKVLDKFDIVVFADSTLGYEAMARGNKVAVFSARKRYQKGTASNFGWPKKIKRKGFFYTDKISEEEVNRILNNISNCEGYYWKKKTSKILNEIIVYNKDNKILKKVLNNYLK